MIFRELRHLDLELKDLGSFELAVRMPDGSTQLVRSVAVAELELLDKNTLRMESVNALIFSAQTSDDVLEITEPARTDPRDSGFGLRGDLDGDQYHPNDSGFGLRGDT